MQNHIQVWLESVCNNLQVVVGGVVVLTRETSLVRAAEWPPHFAGSDVLTTVAQSLIDTRGQTQVNPVKPDNAVSAAITQSVSVLITRQATIAGAVTLGLSAAGTSQEQYVLSVLQREISVLESMLDLDAAPIATVDAGAILQLQATILSRPHFDEAAATFATLAAQLLGFQRICVGLLEDKQVTLVAISHGAALDIHQEINQNLAAAMEEAVDQSATIFFPYSEAAHPRITLAHAELVKRNGGSVCTVPIVNLGKITGAVTAELDSNDVSSHQIALLEQVVALAGPLLALKRDSQLPWRKQARQFIHRAKARLTGPGEHQFKLIAGSTVLGAIILLLVPMPYHVSAPARLEGSTQRALVAPVDGYIQQVSVRPGDTVKEGQILAEFATQDLILERSKRESELAQQENAYGAALALNDRSQLMVNQAKVAESRAQLDLAESQIERARIKAPFNGIVISGDLNQSLGAPIQRGGVLMVIAPHDSYRLIIEVDERDVADIKPGAIGRVSLSAMPSDTLSFHTKRVTPVAVTRDGRHFFELEGKLDTNTPSLRPGLQGVAKIDADKRTLAWALSHRFLIWLRLGLWTWIG